MSASAVRMGRAFVEIGADPAKLFKSLQQVNARIGKFAGGLRSVGTKMMAAGTAMAAPIAAAAVQGARFEDVLLNMRASTGATAQEMGQVRSAALAMSQALGIGPTEAASGFLELMKAGMSLEQVLGGAGQAAVQFAKVGQMDVSQAAVVMADAMAVFGVGGEQAANTLSAAADASSTDIQGIALAFSQVSAVAGLANQSIGDTAAALAILANSGVKGSDAGTSLKTMLMRLMAPADDAAEALAEIGLSVDSFRNADGRVRSMAQIIGTLNTAMAGMGGGARDDVFRRIFGQDAIRAAAILTTAGTEGFGSMVQSMDQALPVGAKFDQLMSGLSGTTTQVLASLQRLAIAVTEAVGPSLMQVGQRVAEVVGGMTTWASANGETVAAVAKGIAVFVGAGAALYGLGAALGLVSTAISLVLNPFVLIPTLIGAAVGAVLSFTGVLDGLGSIVSTTFAGIYESIAAGDLAGAMDILWTGLQAGWLRGVANFMTVFEPWIDTVVNVFTFMTATVLSAWDVMANGVMLVWDNLTASIAKGWAYVESFFKSGINLEAEYAGIDNEMAARAQQRGMATRDRFADARDAADARLSTDNAAAYRSAAAAAESTLANRTSGARLSNVLGKQGADLLAAIGQATSLDQLRDMYGEFEALSSTGKLAPAQVIAIEDALADAQERITSASQPAGSGAGIAAGAAAAGVGTSQAEVAGTFSAAAISGMGVGSSLAQKQVDLLTDIRDNTAQMTDGGTVKE